MKDLVSYSPTNAFLLNIYAIHNYQHVATLIPPSLYSQLNTALVSDHQIIHLNAAKAVHAKTSAAEGNNESVVISEDPEQAHAFDRTQKGPKGKGKGKEKATVAENTQDNQQEVLTVPTAPHSVPVFTVMAPPATLHPPMHQKESEGNGFDWDNPPGTWPEEDTGSCIPDRAPSESLSEPPPVQFCSPHTNSTENKKEWQHKLKWCKWHATHIFQALNLPEGSLDEYLELEEDEMFLTLHGMLKAGFAEKKSEVETFIMSSNFKAFALKNLSTFKIPSEVVKDPELLGEIDTSIKDTHTAAIKHEAEVKLAGSIKSKLHISQLARSLAPLGHYETTMNHWACYAFLHNSLVTFDDLVDESTAAVTVEKVKKKKRATVTRTDETAPETEPENIMPSRI
ncbi:hypothetical protein J3A83DRAFT_4368801 [Scleroderma citrinum]